MNEIFTQAITVFFGFFAIMNPIANTAVFASLVGNKRRTEQVKIATKALLVTFCIIVAFSILGKAIFNLFGITLPALRITGGILVFLVGYQMLTGDGSELHSAAQNDDSDSDIAVSPLAVPLLAGPGTIATAMNYSATADMWGIAMTLLVFAFLCVITFFCFIFSSQILTLIGKSGLSIVTRLMGLILAVIGTQMLIIGITDIIKGPLLN
ncbi:multiple antibiotic resistance (MarC)-like protein [Psychromonas sp. CNPT3]|uniref:MarC family protein n=1 Tax=Psychromonas sp. CNPT3 TaxID=314282 RepID=UPI00006E5688|nr:MarC family protein [Psychromonas sp. CNPT3]AGH81509.1 multiple antibiotic resistance (MarC)-like protein [Psychromonas sp. CNPT3]